MEKEKWWMRLVGDTKGCKELEEKTKENENCYMSKEAETKIQTV